MVARANGPDRLTAPSMETLESPVPAEAFGPNWAMWHDVVAHPQVQGVLQSAARPLEALVLAMGSE